MPAVETTGSQGTRNGRVVPGSVIRRIQTAPETITKANRVPILTSSARNPKGASAAAAATTTPTMMVDFQGVLNRGWTAAKSPGGRRPSRAMAIRMRGWLRLPTRSELVMPARMPSVIKPPAKVRPWACKAADNGALMSIWRYGNHPGQDDRDRHVQDGADRERPHDADRQVALRATGLFGVRRDRVEADIGDKHPSRPLGHAPPLLVLVQERMPVPGIDVGRPDADDREDHRDVEQHHRRVEPRAFLDPDHQDDGDDRRDEHGREVEPGEALLPAGEGDPLEQKRPVVQVVNPGGRG